MSLRAFSLPICVLSLCLLTLPSVSQLLSFQIVANKKTKSCLNEWFPGNETLALSYNMDEHLTKLIRGVGTNQKKQTAILENLTKNVNVQLFGNNEELLKEFKGKLAGTFTYVTEDYQVWMICVENGTKEAIIMGNYTCLNIPLT